MPELEDLQAEIDEVWLMRCYEHLGGRWMAAPEDRLQMRWLAAHDVRGVGVFDYEIAHAFRGESYHLVKLLLEEDLAKNRCDFRLMIGQDNAEGFSSWSSGESLERMLPFLVVPRPGSNPPDSSAWYVQAPHVFLRNITHQETTSSTEVRRRVRAQDPNLAELLPESVLEYVRSHKLYLYAPFFPHSTGSRS